MERLVFIIGIPLVLPDPELLAVFRLVLLGVVVGENVDYFAAEVDVLGLLEDLFG